MIVNVNKSTSRLPQVSLLVQSVAFSIPSIGMALVQLPVNTILAGVYAKYFGLSLSIIASVMLVARIFDAITDPVIGYLSDRSRVNSGSRKPFIITGGILLVPCSYFLFSPYGDVDGLYFTFWYLSFYLALTIFFIPYLAWINEFTTSTKEKTLVFSVSTVFGQIGGAIFYIIPFFPFFTSQAITPQVLQVTVILSAFFLLAGLVVALKYVPNGKSIKPVMKKGRRLAIKRVYPLIHSIIGNRPFLLFVTAFAFLGVGSGMWAGMFYIYVDIYLNLGEEFVTASLFGVVFGIVSVTLWYRLVLLMGKRRAWMLGMSILLVVYLLTSLLSPLTSGFIELLAINMLMLVGISSMGVISGPMLCDVIDYDCLKNGAARNATYFSIFTLLTKIQGAIGSALGIGIAAWFGFDSSSSVQSASAVFGLHIGSSWLPALLVGIGIIFIAVMPLTETRMAVVRRRLNQRASKDGPR